MKLRLVIFALCGWMLFVFQAASATFYVDINSSNPTPPYTNLSTAAANIQDAIDVATNGDLILVNDGFYQDGFRVIQEPTTIQPSPLRPPTTIVSTNRIVLNKAVTVQSLNGPAAAYISGGGIYRCAYLTNGAVLNGFTLINGQAGYLSITPTFRGGFITTSNILNGGGVAGYITIGGNSCWLSNCVLTANAAWGDGGGVSGCHLVNCTVTDNAATSGGGAYESQLFNCLVSGNSAQTVVNSVGSPFPNSTVSGVGGGIYLSSAVNCLIANNTAFEGGGVFDSTGLANCTVVNNSASFVGGVRLNGLSLSPYSYAYNCIIYSNTAGTNANFMVGDFSGDHCCTFPLPTSGKGNITNDPALMDLVNGDFHLSSNSPCINAGNNSAISLTNDFDGNPRIAGGTVDIGAFEFPNPTSVLSYAWAQQYGLPTDGSADFVDSDGDGLNNWQEFIADTNPTNAASCLKMTVAYPIGSPLWTAVKWQSVSTRNYFLQRSTNLASGFSTILTNIAGTDGTTITFDATATNGGSYFYKVGVQ